MDDIEVTGSPVPHGADILTGAAVQFVSELNREFGRRRTELLAARWARRAQIARDHRLDFLPETAELRADESWRVAPAPPDLLDRRAEITGPTERKMAINPLNSGARIWLADRQGAGEAADGFDGSWVAHPDLVPICQEVFDAALGDRPNQLHLLRDDVRVAADQLLDVAATAGSVTAEGLRNNVEVALLCMESWLRGTGAAAIHNLMEDAATAEIARSQLWQWIRNGTELDDGRPVTTDLVAGIIATEYERLQNTAGDRLADARQLLEQVVLGEDYADFLTLPAYELIVTEDGR